MALNLVPKVKGGKKPEVRRVDPQGRISLPDDVRKALRIETDDYVYFTIKATPSGEVLVSLRKVQLGGRSTDDDDGDGPR